MTSESLTENNGAYAQAEREHNLEREQLLAQQREIADAIEDLAALSLLEGSGKEHVSTDDEGNKTVAIKFGLEGGAVVRHIRSEATGETRSRIEYPGAEEGQESISYSINESPDRKVSISEAGQESPKDEIDTLHDSLTAKRNKKMSALKSANTPMGDNKPLFSSDKPAAPRPNSTYANTRHVIVD